MRKHSLYLLLNFALIVSVFTSCKDDEIVPLTTKQKLVAGEWKGEVVMANGIDISSLPQVSGLFPDIKTMVLDFKEDNTYTATYSNDNTGNQSSTGMWELLENDTKLRLDLVTEVMTINELTDEKLNLGATVTNTGFPGSVVVEARFVK